MQPHTHGRRTLVLARRMRRQARARSQSLTTTRGPGVAVSEDIARDEPHVHAGGLLQAIDGEGETCACLTHITELRRSHHHQQHPYQPGRNA